MNTYLNVDRENISASIILDTLSMNITTQINLATISVSEDNGEWISQPIKLHRNGNISSVNHISPYSNWQYRLGREIIWFGNCEDEGCTLWNLNSNDEWYDDTEAYEGEYSICQRRYPSSGDNIITNIEKLIKRYANQGFMLHGYIKTQNGKDVTIEVRYYYNRYYGSYISQENIGTHIDGNTNWTFYYQELDVPDNCNFFDIRLNSDCPETGEALSWFDNIGIIEWSEWKDFDFNEEIKNPNDYYYLQIKANSEVNNALINYSETNYAATPPVIIDNSYVIPAKGKLYANYPNPFNPTTTISFSLTAKDAKNAKIEIYNIKGQKVKTFSNLQINKSPNQQIIWNGKDNNNKEVGSGIYFYQLRIGNKNVAIKKCLLLK